MVVFQAGRAFCVESAVIEDDIIAQFRVPLEIFLEFHQDILEICHFKVHECAGLVLLALRAGRSFAIDEGTAHSDFIAMLLNS